MRGLLSLTVGISRRKAGASACGLDVPLGFFRGQRPRKDVMRSHQIEDVVPGYPEKPGRSALRDYTVAQKVEDQRFPSPILNAVQRFKRCDEGIG